MKPVIIICRIAILLLTLELCARADDLFQYGANPWKPYVRETTIEQEDGFGITGKPNSRYKKWIINNLGFRGLNETMEKRYGTIRVICAGASETFGLYEDKENEWPAQLGRRLKSIDNDIEVINASFYGSGYFFHNIIRRFESQWKYLRPDYLVIYATPLSYIYESGDQDNGKRSPAVISKEERKVALLQNIRIIGKVRDVYRKYVPKPLLDIKDRENSKRQIWANLRKDKRKILSLAEAEKNIEEDILKLKDSCKENGTVLILSSHVMRTDSLAVLQGRIYLPQLSGEELVDAHRRLNECVRRIAERESIVFVNNAKSCVATPENLADNSHFTNKGAAIIADDFYSILAELIMKNA